jgi:hypothetical protein
MELKDFPPLLSLILPLHQPRLDYLEELLDSLPLNQPELEIVVGINPLPSTPKVQLRSWLAKWQNGARWQIVEHSRPYGVNAHFYVLQKMARGIWFAPVDQDDRWQPFRWQGLQPQLRDIHRQNRPLLLAGNPQLCNAHLEKLVDTNQRFTLKPLLEMPSPLRWLRTLLLNPVPGCCCFYNRAMIKSLGWPAPLPLSPYYDHQLMLRALVSPHCTVETLQAPSVDWRRHQGCVSGSKLAWFAFFLDRMRLLAALITPRMGS